MYPIYHNFLIKFKINCLESGQIKSHDSNAAQTSVVLVDFESYSIYSSDILQQLSIQIHGKFKLFFVFIMNLNSL